MKIPVFKLEEYFQKWEFTAPYLLCSSDLETMNLQELLSMADLESKKRWDEQRFGYTEVQGSPILLSEISKLYQTLRSENILTFAGGEEGIFAAMQTLLQPTDHVIVVVPCYQSHQSIPEMIGCEISEVQLDPIKNWNLELGQIQQAIRKNTKMIIFNFPNNPTGKTLSLQELQALVVLARKHGIYLFSDEAYSLTELNIHDRMPPIADLYERGISLGVMSKAFGLPGLRVGWIATQDAALIQRINHTKHYLSLCNSGPSEILSIIALRSKDRILERNYSIMRENIKLLDVFFRDYSDVLRWNRPTGGCIGFVELNLGESIDSIAASLVKEEGVLILPGTKCGWPGNFFRIGFGRKNMPESLSRFQRFIDRKIRALST